MRKGTQNFILFTLMSLSALFQAVSGFVMWLALPHEGYRGGRGIGTDEQATFLWTRDTWIDIHDWVAVALLVLLMIHLILHWKWIVYQTKRIFSQK